MKIGVLMTVLIDISGETLLVPFILRVHYSRACCASPIGKIFHAILDSLSAALIIHRSIKALIKPGINCLQALQSNHTILTTQTPPPPPTPRSTLSPQFPHPYPSLPPHLIHPLPPLQTARKMNQMAPHPSHISHIKRPGKHHRNPT